MLLKRRSHYQQLPEFERGHIIRIKNGEFSFHRVSKRLGRNVSPVQDGWPGKGSISRRSPQKKKHCRIRRIDVEYRSASTA
ncbi:hypothetical protein TNCV_4549311 [Trichonephila clavipes]|nr:hypothetical protein TNCV_4549311 [Trichonephila clavipes]